MLSLSASGLLTLWEEGRDESRIRQALLLLAASCPEIPPEDLTKLSIGRRDRLLLKLRDEVFGPHLMSVTRCPACGDRLQLTFDVCDVLTETEQKVEEPLTMPVNDYEVCFRLPNSSDQTAIAGCEEVAAARKLLLTRCLLEVRHGGEEQPVDQVTETFLDRVAEQMAQADPQANVQLDLTCPACAHTWSAPFDIVSYLWQEIDAWAQHILRDIHSLASAYGWHEADILNMSARRRQLYLNLIGV